MPVLADYLKSIDLRNEARAAELRTAFETEVRAAETRLREAWSLQLQTFLVTGLQAAATAVLPRIDDSRLTSPGPGGGGQRPRQR